MSYLLPITWHFISRSRASLMKIKIKITTHHFCSISEWTILQLINQPAQPYKNTVTPRPMLNSSKVLSYNKTQNIKDAHLALPPFLQCYRLSLFQLYVAPQFPSLTRIIPSIDHVLEEPHLQDANFLPLTHPSPSSPFGSPPSNLDTPQAAPTYSS